jgi:hypothetical protein
MGSGGHQGPARAPASPRLDARGMRQALPCLLGHGAQTRRPAGGHYSLAMEAGSGRLGFQNETLAVPYEQAFGSLVGRLGQPAWLGRRAGHTRPLPSPSGWPPGLLSRAKNGLLYYFKF